MHEEIFFVILIMLALHVKAARYDINIIRKCIAKTESSLNSEILLMH